MSISGCRNIFNSNNPDNVGNNDIVTPGEFNNAIKGMKTLCERYGVDKKLQDNFFAASNNLFKAYQNKNNRNQNVNQIVNININLNQGANQNVIQISNHNSNNSNNTIPTVNQITNININPYLNLIQIDMQLQI